jgi:GTP-binding protein Era
MVISSYKNFKSGYVAIVGQPNVGKSTLLNSLLQFKVSSVTRKAQTTRHQVRGILSGENYQIVFFDTPGILEPEYELHKAMLQAVSRSVQDADVVLFIVAASDQHDPYDAGKLGSILAENKKVVLAVNKIDRIQKNLLLPLLKFYGETFTLNSVVPISALKSDGLQQLRNVLVEALPVGVPFYDPADITDHPERFIVSEIIREKIFERYGEEIPYATTVQIDEFTERKSGKDFIRAIIFVERASQKGILIGRKGEALQRVGKQARAEIEETLGRGVFLELWVKVKEKWRKDPQSLKEFGYT